MSIFDIFKRTWSPGTMTGEDRKKIFWYLKRKTSYTTWAIEAERFDRFAEVYEKQVKEEPIAPGLLGGTNWAMLQTRVLKAQFLYEQALERLLRGDKTVFLYNSLGAMEQAKEEASYWYTELINKGMRGDHRFFGKYLPELESLIEDFARPAMDQGLLETMMVDTPAPQLWASLWLPDLYQLPFPPNLPEVPEQPREILVRTGDTAPVFGIYEPQIKDGCMNYLMGGSPAPTMWESDGEGSTGNKLAVTWRLIWEDTRYLDGTIPAEERQYFPAAPAPAAPARAVQDDLLSAPSGAICPKSGNWVVMDRLDARCSVEQGNAMPQCDGRDVMWVWVGR